MDPHRVRRLKKRQPKITGGARSGERRRGPLWNKCGRCWKGTGVPLPCRCNEGGKA